MGPVFRLLSRNDLSFQNFKLQFMLKIIRSIQNRIYDVRGERVMLDLDLAVLYEVETRVLNQAVKRNIGRFPKDFMFQLKPFEYRNITGHLELLKKSSSSQI